MSGMRGIVFILLLCMGVESSFGKSEVQVARDGAQLQLKNLKISFTVDAYMKAAATGRLDLCKLFLRGGMDVDSTDAQGWTPIMHAIAGQQPEVVEFYLAKSASLRTCDDAGWTPLIFASYYGTASVVQSLIAKGAEVDAITRRGTSALIAATGNGHADIVEVLLVAKADPMQRDESGKDALRYAEEKGYQKIFQLVNDALDRARRPKAGTREAVLEEKALTGGLIGAAGKGDLRKASELVTQRAKVDGLDANGWTPLMHAIAKNQSQMVGFLLGQGANPNFRDDLGWTPLILAAYHSRLDLIQFLVANGADVNARTNKGTTALISAAGAGNMEIVRLLIADGADLQIKDAEGKRALDYAREKQRDAVVAVLTESNQTVHRFMEAFYLILDGDEAIQKEKTENAVKKYTAALKILDSIKLQSPDWNPYLLAFRINYCVGNLNRLRQAAQPIEKP